MNETYLTMVGRMCSEVAMAEAGGVPRATFRIACNERWVDRKTGEWSNGSALFMSVTCWRRLAENVARSLSMGDPVVVRGRLHTRYFDKEGRQTSVLMLDAVAVGPDLSWCTAAVTRARRAGSGGQPDAAASVPVQRPPVESELEDVGEPEWRSGPLVRPSEREAAVSA